MNVQQVKAVENLASKVGKWGNGGFANWLGKSSTPWGMKKAVENQKLLGYAGAGAMGLFGVGQLNRAYHKAKYGEYGGAALSTAMGVAAGFAAHRIAMPQNSLQNLFRTNMSKLEGRLMASAGAMRDAMKTM